MKRRPHRENITSFTTTVSVILSAGQKQKDFSFDFFYYSYVRSYDRCQQVIFGPVTHITSGKSCEMQCTQSERNAVVVSRQG